MCVFQYCDWIKEKVLVMLFVIYILLVVGQEVFKCMVDVVFEVGVVLIQNLLVKILYCGDFVVGLLWEGCDYDF